MSEALLLVAEGYEQIAAGQVQIRKDLGGKEPYRAVRFPETVGCS